MTATIFSLPLPKAKKAGSTGDHQQWGQLKGSSRALAVSQAYKQHKGPVVVITADTPSAMKLQRELAWFLDNDRSVTTLFPDWETLPYDMFSPHQDIVSQRMETLYRMANEPRGIFIVPVNTLMQRLAPVDYLNKYLLMVHKGDTLDREQFRRNLEQAGYLHVNQVMSHSEFSIRGSIIDLFPMGSDRPFRIDLFDDEIDSIRYFETENQRSADAVDEIRLLPAREFPTDKAALSAFRARYLETFDSNSSQESVLSQVSKGTMPGGIEYYLPLFFDHTATLFDYLHDNAVLMLHGDVMDASEFYWADVAERYEQRRYDLSRPLLSPEALFLPVNQLFEQVKNWPRISLHTDALEEKAGKSNLGCESLKDIAFNPQKKQPAQALTEKMKAARNAGSRVLFCAESQGRRENLLTLLNKAGIRPEAVQQFSAFIDSDVATGICVGLVENSFELQREQGNILFITETELLGHKVSQRRLRDKRQATD